MTVTFAGVGKAHNGWTMLDTLASQRHTAACDCGHLMKIPDFMGDMLPEDAIDELHLSHREQERQEWLKRNGYGPIDVRWASCLFCGCLVGGIDEHRTVCP